MHNGTDRAYLQFLDELLQYEDQEQDILNDVEDMNKEEIAQYIKDYTKEVARILRQTIKNNRNMDKE